MDQQKKYIWLGLTLQQMETAMEEIGEKPFRARQLADWIYQKGVFEFAEMTNFSKDFRGKLEAISTVGMPKIHQLLESRQDPVKKTLLELEDGEIVESVLMKYNYGNSVCVSSQAGCKMNCSFCATGLGGYRRNLTAGEMLAQVLMMRQVDEGQRVSHIVLMGMGEPLDNYDEMLLFLKIANAPWGLGIGYRHISVSTCGLTPQIARLQKEDLPINLSISLHAPNDRIRQQIMPIAKKYPMDELLVACKEYSEQTKRRITFEYNMIHGVNDSPEHAKELAGKLKRMLAFVNLIPLNSVPETKLYRSSQATIQQFSEVLTQNGIESTIRREMGGDIWAACGQLRGQFNR